MSIKTTLTCREFITFLDDYVDGRLPEERQIVFETHLSRCAQCVDYLDSYRLTVAMTTDIGRKEQVAEEAPPDFVNAILAAKRTG